MLDHASALLSYDLHLALPDGVTLASSKSHLSGTRLTDEVNVVEAPASHLRATEFFLPAASVATPHTIATYTFQAPASTYGPLVFSIDALTEFAVGFEAISAGSTDLEIGFGESDRTRQSAAPSSAASSAFAPTEGGAMAAQGEGQSEGSSTIGNKGTDNCIFFQPTPLVFANGGTDRFFEIPSSDSATNVKFYFYSLPQLLANFSTVKTDTEDLKVVFLSPFSAAETNFDLTDLTGHVIITQGGNHGGTAVSPSSISQDPTQYCFDGDFNQSGTVVSITGDVCDPQTARFSFGWIDTAPALTTDSPYDSGALTADDLNMGGFEVKRGRPFAAPLEGGGISVDTNCRTDIAGCYIHSNEPAVGASTEWQRGGGIAVYPPDATPPGCDPEAEEPDNDEYWRLIVAGCDISENVAESLGAGIYVDPSGGFLNNVHVLASWIYRNDLIGTFSAQSNGQSPSLDGGGIYSARSNLAVCSSQIYENRAIRGAGIHFRYPGENPNFTTECTIYDNVLRDNSLSLTPSDAKFVTPTGSGTPTRYQGAGVFMGQLAGPGTGGIRDYLVLLNRLAQNGRDQVGPTSTVEYDDGGGLFMEFELASDPMASPPLQEVGGNAAFENFAADAAAGIYMDLVNQPSTSSLDTSFIHNSVFENESVTNSALVNPIGLLVTGDTEVNLRNSIVHDHVEASGTDRDWAITNSNVNTDIDYTCLPSPVSLGSIAIGTNSITTAPEFQAVTDVLRRHRQEGVVAPVSPTIDAGSGSISSGNLTRDLDFERRSFGSAPDMGADEYLPPPEFRRGDANLDGSVAGLPDVIAILAFLFQGAPSDCYDAMDVDDDGTNALPDAIYLLDYLFSAGPVPPAPGTSCGLDLTADSLSCNSNNGTCP